MNRPNRFCIIQVLSVVKVKAKTATPSAAVRSYFWALSWGTSPHSLRFVPLGLTEYEDTTTSLVKCRQKLSFLMQLFQQQTLQWKRSIGSISGQSI